MPRAVQFFALLTTMAYTANLASFLIEENQKSVYLSGIDDANSNSVAVCGMAGQTSFLTLANYARIRQVHKRVQTPPFYYV
jgi:hypothetical protein